MSTYEILFTIALGMLLPLVIHAVVLNTRAKHQAANIAQLNDVIHRMTREQIKSSASVHRLERKLEGQNDRLEAVDTRSSGGGGQRIESAVRVARQGGANASLLRDLGLSDAEASLLMRLHDPEPQTESIESQLPTQAASLANLLAQSRQESAQPEAATA